MRPLVLFLRTGRLPLPLLHGINSPFRSASPGCSPVPRLALIGVERQGEAGNTPDYQDGTPPESGERKTDGICLGPKTQKVGHSLLPIMTTEQEVGARLSFRSRLGTLRLSSEDSPHFSRRLSAQISASTSCHHSSSGLRQIQVAQERDSGIPREPSNQ